MFESEVDNILSRGDKLQDLIINKVNFNVHDTYEKGEKLTTNFEPVNDEDAIKKTYLDEQLKKRSLVINRKRLQ